MKTDILHSSDTAGPPVRRPKGGREGLHFEVMILINLGIPYPPFWRSGGFTSALRLREV